MGLFKPAWESDKPKTRLRGVKKLKDQKLLLEFALNDKVEDINIAAVHALTDQMDLARVATGSRKFIVSLSATERLTDPAALITAARHFADWSKGGYLLLDVLDKLQRAGSMDERGWMEILNSLKGVPVDDSTRTQIERYFAQITTPSVLLSFSPTAHNAVLDGLYLSRVIALASKDPGVFTQFQAKAQEIMGATHTDATRQVGGKHQDFKQLVRGSSSDCHDDNLPWKPAMTPFGYGYHGDGYVNGTSKHEDSYPLRNRFSPYFKDKDEKK